MELFLRPRCRNGYCETVEQMIAYSFNSGKGYRPYFLRVDPGYQMRLPYQQFAIFDWLPTDVLWYAGKEPIIVPNTLLEINEDDLKDVFGYQIRTRSARFEFVDGCVLLQKSRYYMPDEPHGVYLHKLCVCLSDDKLDAIIAKWRPYSPGIEAWIKGRSWGRF